MPNLYGPEEGKNQALSTADAELLPDVAREEKPGPWGPAPFTGYPKSGYALALAREGLRVHPLIENGKKPVLTGFGHRARKAATEAGRRQIEWWWRAQNYNIGVATGPGGRIIVIDVDVKDGKPGLASLERLEREYDLPQSYRVKTPSGGLHVYLRLPPDVYIGNSTSWLPGGFDGIDVRGNAGQAYVVGAGSTIDGEAYVAIGIPADTADCPEKLLKLIKPAATSEIERRKTRVPACELDTPYIIKQATQWLKHDAPCAIQGQSGDATTVYVAMCLSDMGVSEGKALELMDEHWNNAPDDGGRADPPWDLDELEVKVRNGYAYAHNQPGCDAPVDAQEEFDVVEIPDGFIKVPGKDAWLNPKPVEELDPETIPDREWIVKGLLVRENVSILVAPPSAGKTQLLATAAIAVASGKSEVLGLDVVERTRAWYWNQEDPLMELNRRIAAARLQAGLDWADVRDAENKEMLFVNSGVESPLKLAIRLRNGELGASDELAKIIQKIKDKDIGLFIIDPLVEFHEGEENDNKEMHTVLAMARKIAVATHCAVLVAAHSRKPPQANSDGFAGNMDILRGGGSQTGVARIVATLFSMSEKDAKLYGINTDDRGKYVRLDGAKINLGKRSNEPLWYEWTSIPLRSGGEEIGALGPAALRRVTQTNAFDLVQNVADAISFHFSRGEWYGLSELLPVLSEDLQAALAGKTHRARNATKYLAAQGLRFSDDAPEQKAQTPFGALQVKKTRGPKGLQFLLEESAEGGVVNSPLIRQVSSGELMAN